MRKPPPVERVYGGTFGGPVIEVTGEAAALDALALRLDGIPSLPWMRGSVVLRHRPDLAQVADARLAVRQGSAKDAALEVLQAAAQLGMIAGRGVPARPRLPRKAHA